MVIGASLTVGGYILPPVLAVLLRNSPGIEIQLKVSPPHECVAALKAGECDLVIAHLDPGRNVDGLDIIRVRDERGGSRHDLERGALRVIETPGLDLFVPVNLIKRADKALTPVQEKVRAFVQRELTSTEPHSRPPR